MEQLDSGQGGHTSKRSFGGGGGLQRSSSSTSVGHSRYSSRQRSGGLKSLTDKILEKATNCPSKCDLSPTTLKNLLNPGKFLRTNALRSSLETADRENFDATYKIQKRVSQINLQEGEKNPVELAQKENIERSELSPPASQSAFNTKETEKLTHDDNQMWKEKDEPVNGVFNPNDNNLLRSYSMPNIPTPQKPAPSARLYQPHTPQFPPTEQQHPAEEFMKPPVNLTPYYPIPNNEPKVQQAALNLKKTPVHLSVPSSLNVPNEVGKRGQTKTSPPGFEQQGVALVIPAHLQPQPVGNKGEFGFKQPLTPQFKRVHQKPFTPKSDKPEKKKWKFSTETVKGQEYLVIKPLGKGGEGEVSLVIENDSRQLFALKKVNLAALGEINRRECINEVKLLIELKNTSFVIQIHSWEMNNADQTLKIVMEYGYCDLSDSINKEIMSLIDIKFIWRRMLLIVEKIHSKGIVHADLKPANFVWVGKILKIIDFGIASRLQTDHTSIHTLNPKGTINYICPELISMNEQGISKMSPKSDIWALGCILYLMAYGKTPFQDIAHNQAKMMAISTANIKYSNIRSELENSGILEVLYLCLRRDPKERPTASELLQHSFLK